MGATWLRMEADSVLDSASLQSPVHGCRGGPAGQSETLLCQTPLGLLGTSLTSGLSAGPTAAGQLQGPQLEMY